MIVSQWHAGIHGQNFTTENQTQSSNETNTTIMINPSRDVNEKAITNSSCEKRAKPYFLPHKVEASQFYVCVKGQLFLLNCPSGYRFDNEIDQCTRKTIPNDIEESKFIDIQWIIPNIDELI